MEKDIEFNQLLFSLPEELYNKIYDTYRQMYVFPEIRKKHNKIQKYIGIQNDKIIKYKLFDIGDFHQFNYELQNTDYKYKEYFIYNKKCIVGVLEYYYSLNYNKRQLLAKTINVSNVNDAEHAEQVYNNTTKMVRFLKNKELSYLIDPEDIHSGSSGMWVFSIVMKFMFGTYKEKFDLWRKLIESHF